jgi:hypothetical protein
MVRPTAQEIPTPQKGGKMTTVLPNRMIVAMAALLGVMGLFIAIHPGSASAADGSGPIYTVEDSGVGHFNLNLKGTILEDVHIKGTKANSPKCHWADGYNSGRGVNGQLYWFWDTHMWVCPSPHSPTKWAKEGGGKSGRKCENPVQIHGPPPGPIVTQYTILASFKKLHMVVTAPAHAKVSGHCPGTDIGGEASADVNVSLVVDQRMVVQAGGNANSVRTTVTNLLKAQGVTSATAKLKLSCGVSPPPVQVCTDRNASNYGGALPCQYSPVCTDRNATNYGGALPCQYPPAQVCQDRNASNYGGALPCTYPPAKCTDTSATNYGGALPCQYPQPKCTDTSATNYGGPLPCQYPQPKCTDTSATNYGGPLPCTYRPPNAPPSGVLKVAQHMFVNGVDPNAACVDNITDPNGDAVSVSFRFTDVNGNDVGQKIGSPSMNGTAICQNYKAPGTPMQITVFATLTDNGSARGAASNLSTTYQQNFPVVPDQFPG